MELRRMIAAVAASAPFSLFATLAGSQTIDFGANLPAGPIPAGYSGFDWGTGANAAVNGGDDPFNGSWASIVEFGRASPFDLNSVEYTAFFSDRDNFDDFTTVVSGYRGTTLVKSVTERYTNFEGGQFPFTGLNIDGVDKITFSTTDTYGYFDYSTGEKKTVYQGTNVPHPTYVDQLKVSPYKAAPEIDPASAASALTLLLGSLAALRGRRAS